MTIEELMVSKQVYINPADIAEILRCDPQSIREQAQNNPQIIGFPIIIMGKRVRIPRIPFLKYLGYY